MKGILINPYNKTVEAIQYEPGLKNIYTLLDCSTIEAPISYANGDVMYCDEEAWLNVVDDKPIAGFSYPQYAYAILGKSLIVGTGREGETTSCISNVFSISKGIQWHDNELMRNQGQAMGLI